MAFQLLVQMSDHLSPLWDIYLTNEVQLKLFLENHVRARSHDVQGSFRWPKCSFALIGTSSSLCALAGSHSVRLFSVWKQNRVLILTERHKNLGEKLAVLLCLNNTETGWADLDFVCKTDFPPWTGLFLPPSFFCKYASFVCYWELI